MRLRAVVAQAEESGIDHVCVGDHVSFRGGQGWDGLIHATALAVLSDRVAVHTSVYLLPLRHPVPVARQVQTLAQIVPGRFVFGVGAGGDDRSEVIACGIDPATRGRRMDESLAVVRRLLAGETVTHHGEFFDLDDVAIAPAPDQPVPIVVGGRSDSAISRTARLADGWMGLWVSPRRFAEATAAVESEAAAAGRTGVAWRHSMYVWCGFGRTRGEAASLLAARMEGLYRTPFAKFEPYSPHGSPEDVAEALAVYVEAGCRTFHLSPVAEDPATTVRFVADVREILSGTRG